MSIRNLEWYDLNETRSWPLDEQATGIDDAGVRMAGNLITDLNIRFPVTICERAFISAVTVSSRIATVVISADTYGYPALAAVSVAEEIEPYVNYALEPLYPGVGGWLVFGSGAREAAVQTHRFSLPSQSLLIPQVAGCYKPLPIPYIGKLGVNTQLSGIVKLFGGGDLAIVKERREIDEVSQDVIVFKLVADTVDQTASVLSKYVGVCGARPETGNCDGTPPIEVINSVEPDCCGRITLEFRGVAVPYPVVGDFSSVVIDTDFGLSQACEGLDRLPDENGRLPNENEDLCEGLYFPAPELESSSW
jgi:hypothetical protein